MGEDDCKILHDEGQKIYDVYAVVDGVEKAIYGIPLPKLPSKGEKLSLIVDGSYKAFTIIDILGQLGKEGV